MAITKAEFNRLLQKEQDESFLADLAFGIVSMGIGTAIKVAVRAVKGKALEQLSRMASEARLAGTAPWEVGTVGSRLVQQVSPESLSSLVTKRVTAPSKPPSQGEGGELQQKQVTTGFLEQVRNEYDDAFQRLGNQALSLMSDAQLVAYVEAFDIQFHQVEYYQRMFEALIVRFEGSGISSIGRKEVQRDLQPDLGPQIQLGFLEPYAKREVLRDTRLVWHEYLSGYPKQLVYEYHDGFNHPLNFEFARRMDEGNGRPLQFGPALPVTKNAEVGRAVPKEFEAYALKRHRDVWGNEPRTVMIDDSHSYDPMRVAAAMKNKAAHAVKETRK